MFSLTPWKKQQHAHQLTTTPGPLHSRMAQFRDEFNSLLDTFCRAGEHLGSFGWGLGFDENDEEYVLRAEAPGFEAEDFDVQIRGNSLIVSAEHQDETKDEESGSLYHYGRYHRSVPLPAAANTDDITARYHSGVLELHLPKTADEKRKRISVKAN